MTAWPNWDSMLLAYQGDPINKETLAVVDAFQHVEGHGGDFNPFNVGPGPFHGIDLSKAPYSGTPSPYPPTLDFPSPQAGVAASMVVGESNWSGLLAALKTGHPLSDPNWIISQGAATPADQYTAEVRSLAQSYLSGGSTYDLGDTSLNKQEPGAGANIPPDSGSGCASDNFNFGPCSGTIPTPPKDMTGHPCCAQGYQGHTDLQGTCSDANCAKCCGLGIGGGPGGNQTPAPGGGQGCGCIGNPIPSFIPGIGGGQACIIPQGICDFFDAFVSEAFWIRVGEILLGAMLLWIGLSRIVKGLPGPKAAAGAALSVAG